MDVDCDVVRWLRGEVGEVLAKRWREVEWWAC